MTDSVKAKIRVSECVLGEEWLYPPHDSKSGCHLSFGITPHHPDRTDCINTLVHRGHFHPSDLWVINLDPVCSKGSPKIAMQPLPLAPGTSIEAPKVSHSP